jgi:hypothetical protein
VSALRLGSIDEAGKRICAGRGLCESLEQSAHRVRILLQSRERNLPAVLKRDYRAFSKPEFCKNEPTTSKVHR